MRPKRGPSACVSRFESFSWRVHDEIVIEVPEEYAAVAKEWVPCGMINAMAPLIDPAPVEVEAKVGRTWAG